MSLDLSGIQAFVESELMDDECIVTRDPEGTTDDTWDEDEGEYLSAAGDATTIYEGFCWISHGKNQTREERQGALMDQEDVYYLNVPLDAGMFKEGDKVVCTSSLRNANIVGQEFWIKTDQLGTFKVKQKLELCRTHPRALR